MKLTSKATLVDVAFAVCTAGVADEAMGSLGYRRASSGMYEHSDLQITVEFPRGPMSIGRDLIQTWATERRGDERLHILTITDCVRDRFMHFWAWNDRSALELALEVAQRHSERFDADAFRAWTMVEQAADSSYPQEKVDEFFRRLGGVPSGPAQATTEI
jgi:hypothetical protein